MIMMIFIGFLFLLIGLGVFAGGVFSVFKVSRRLDDSAKAEGTVIAFGKKAGKRGFIYCPQVEFSIPNGQSFRFESGFGTQPPSYRVGQKVEVVYKTANPPEAEINSAMALWFAPGCMVLMALVCAGLGATLFGIGVLVELQK